MRNIQVGDIMVSKITVAGTQHKFSQILEFFNVFSIRHLPVTENDRLLGIISIHDVLHLIQQKLATGESINLMQMDALHNAGNMMTTSPVTVTPETSLEDALLMLSAGGYHALPVVEGNMIKGIVTEHDMLIAYHKEKTPPTFFETGAPGFGI